MDSLFSKSFAKKLTFFIVEGDLLKVVDSAGRLTLYWPHGCHDILHFGDEFLKLFHHTRFTSPGLVNVDNL